MIPALTALLVATSTITPSSQELEDRLAQRGIKPIQICIEYTTTGNEIEPLTYRICDNNKDEKIDSIQIFGKYDPTCPYSMAFYSAKNRYSLEDMLQNKRSVPFPPACSLPPSVWENAQIRFNNVPKKNRERVYF